MAIGRTYAVTIRGAVTTGIVITNGETVLTEDIWYYRYGLLSM